MSHLPAVFPIVLGRYPPVFDIIARLPRPTLDEVLAGSAERTARLTLKRDGMDVLALPALAWTVSCSRTSASRRSLEASITGLDELIPTVASSVLDPRARLEVWAEMGVSDPRFGQWWEPVGVFPITKTSVQVTAKGASISISGPDRTDSIRRARLTKAVEITQGTSPEEAIATLLAELADWLPLRLYLTGLEMPDAIAGQLGGDRWKLAQEDIARAAGADLFLTRLGEVELRRVVDVATAGPDWIWRISDATFTALTRDLDGASMPDGMIVPWGKRGAYLIYPDANRREYALFDGDPTLITSEAHAIWVASRELLKAGRGQEKVTVTVPADPRVEPGDVVQLEALDYGVRLLGQIDSFSLEATAGTMAVTIADRVMT